MNKTVEEIGKINFEGNIIPANWYKHITFSSGKPNLNAIVILAEIVYWYRPTIIRDPATGEIKGYKTKFSADKLQRSYQSFADQFGISKRQAQDAIKLLRDLGLITLEFRTITMPTSGLKLTNVMFIEPVPERIKEITYNNIKEIDNSDDNSVHYNTSYDETEEVEHKVNGVTTQRNTSYDRTEEVSPTNAGGQTPECGTITENTSQTTNKDYLLPDSVSLSSRSSDNKLVTRSKLSLQEVSVLCSSTKIDNHSTYNPPKDTVSIIYNKPDISLDKTLSLKPVIELDISFKAPVVEPDISFKELDIEPAVESVNKPVAGTVAMLEDKTGKILNKSLNKPVDDLDIEPEVSFNVPDSELDISTIESEEDAYAILVRDGFINPSDPDDPFRDLWENIKSTPPYVEYTDEELEEILKKLNAGTSCSEKKSNFERSGKILNNEQNKPKKDLFKPFSFDDFFGSSDKVAPDISRVLASKKQNNTSESTDGKNLNSSLNKPERPEKDLDNAIDMPEDILANIGNMDFDDIFASDETNKETDTSFDKEPDTSHNVPEKEPERNVIIPDNALKEPEYEPAGINTTQTSQNGTDLQECPSVEDTNIFTHAAKKCDTDRHGLHVFNKADVTEIQGNQNADSNADLKLHHFVTTRTEQGFEVVSKGEEVNYGYGNWNDCNDDDWKMLEKYGFTVIDEGSVAEAQADAQSVLEKDCDKTCDDDWKAFEEYGFTVVDEIDNTKQPDTEKVPEKQSKNDFDGTEQDFIRMLEEAFNAKVIDDIESDINGASDTTEKHVDCTKQDFVKMLEEAFDAKVVDDAESDIANVEDEAHVDNSQQAFIKMLEKAGFSVVDDAESDVVSAISGPEKLVADGAENLPNAENNRHDVRLADEPDTLSFLSESGKADKHDEIPVVTEFGRDLNKPEKVRKTETDSKFDKACKAKVISLTERRYAKSLDAETGMSINKPESLLYDAFKQRQSQIAFANRYTNTLQKCFSCKDTDSLITAAKKEKVIGISGLEGLELAVNAGMRKRQNISSDSPPDKEIFRNLLAVSRQEHQNLTFTCEGGI